MSTGTDVYAHIKAPEKPSVKLIAIDKLMSRVASVGNVVGV